jgi:hypothetical protein
LRGPWPKFRGEKGLAPPLQKKNPSKCPFYVSPAKKISLTFRIIGTLIVLCTFQNHNSHFCLNLAKGI